MNKNLYKTCGGKKSKEYKHTKEAEAPDSFGFHNKEIKQ